MAARGNTGAKLGTKRSVREEWNYHSRKTRKTLPRGGMIAQGSAGADCLGGRTSRINSYQYEYTPIVSTRRGDECFYIIIHGPKSYPPNAWTQERVRGFRNHSRHLNHLARHGRSSM